LKEKVLFLYEIIELFADQEY